MASGLQLNVFKMFFLSWRSFPFFLSKAALWQREEGEWGTLNGSAVSLG